MALISHIKNFQLIFRYLQVPCRWNSHHKKVKKLPKRYVVNAPLQGRTDSLSSRGFLRNTMPYQPPTDAGDRVLKCFEIILRSAEPNQTIDINQKFNILSALSREFNYTVPNALLYKMKTLGDIFEFYVTPVDTTVPYDRFKNLDLPPNLHILYDYHRFHPQSDTKFDGISAFPKSSTIVTGIKWKKKYAGYTAEPPWMDI